MNPEELEAIVLAGLINGGATPDAFDVIATTPEEAFSIVFHRHAFSEIKKQALANGMIDILFISEALGGSSLADLSQISRIPGDGTESERLCRENGAGLAEPQNGGIVAIWRGRYS